MIFSNGLKVLVGKMFYLYHLQYQENTSILKIAHISPIELYEGCEPRESMDHTRVKHPAKKSISDFLIQNHNDFLKKKSS